MEIFVAEILVVGARPYLTKPLFRGGLFLRGTSGLMVIGITFRNSVSEFS
jgi:hypothetical protein